MCCGTRRRWICCKKASSSSAIALWLGHESVETTQIYLDANLALKQEVLDKTTPPEGKPGRYRPDDRLLAFLKGLVDPAAYVPPCTSLAIGGGEYDGT